MVAKEKMNANRKIARTVGILFIIATVAGFLSVAFLGSMLADPDNLGNFSANKNQVITGALVDLIGAGAFVFSDHNQNEEVISFELELFWGAITLIGIILAIKYRSPFKQILGPMLIGFTGALWVAYFFG